MALALAALPAAGCQPPAGAAKAAGKPAPPAKVEGAPKEADLATVKLTAEAEGRLGVATAVAERKAVPKTTTYAGDVVIPPGRLIAVTSPFVGTIKSPEGATAPVPGASVKEGQPVFVLMPLLSPESRAQMAPLLIEAEGQVKQGKDQLEIAKVAFNRAEDLAKARLGGSAAVVDAKNNYDAAKTRLKAAEDRFDTIAKVASDTESGVGTAQTIESPASGMVQNVHAQAGQKVAAGAALFEVAGLDPVWVKVPVYVGEAPKLDPERPAAVGGLADAPGAAGERPGKPVAAPPSGDPLSATVHLFFEVDNKDGAFRPGQRVGVTLPLKGEAEGLTVPRAALIRDYHGGAWVYEKVGDHAYARRRVLVDRVVGDTAVLASGPKPGAKVVTDGAAELYGTEFGGSK